MQASNIQKSNQRTSLVALLLQLLVAIPVIWLAGGYIFMEFVGALIFGVNKSANYAFLYEIAKYPLAFIVSVPWALIAHFKGRYRQAAFVSVSGIGLFTLILILMPFTL